MNKGRNTSNWPSCALYHLSWVGLCSSVRRFHAGGGTPAPTAPLTPGESGGLREEFAFPAPWEPCASLRGLTRPFWACVSAFKLLRSASGAQRCLAKQEMNESTCVLKKEQERERDMVISTSDKWPWMSKLSLGRHLFVSACVVHFIITALCVWVSVHNRQGKIAFSTNDVWSG